MSENQEQCPKCGSQHVYLDGSFWTCPECGHEFDLNAEPSEGPSPTVDLQTVTDANGNVLADGDTVVVTKELKVKGGSPIKAGTKVKNIRLSPNAADGHNISCKIPGAGAMGLKSEFVKKS